MAARRSTGPPKKRSLLPNSVRASSPDRETVPESEDAEIEPSLASNVLAPPPPVHQPYPQYYEHGGQPPSPGHSNNSSSDRAFSSPMSQGLNVGDFLDRRSRKNLLSRIREEKAREFQAEIEAKDESERTQEEKDFLIKKDRKRLTKNKRTQELAQEKKKEVERILGKPQEERTQEEEETLTAALEKKRRKNRKDHLRRKKRKEEEERTGVTPHTNPIDTSDEIERQVDAPSVVRGSQRIDNTTSASRERPSYDAFPPHSYQPGLKPHTSPRHPGASMSAFLPLAQSRPALRPPQGEMYHHPPPYYNYAPPTYQPLYPSLSYEHEGENYTGGYGSHLPPRQHHPHAGVPFATPPSQYPSHTHDNAGEQMSELSTEEKSEGGVYVLEFNTPRPIQLASVPKMSAAELLKRDNARKNLKNSRARERAAAIRDRAAMIQRKPEYDRTEEEVIFLNNFVSKKAKRNLRGRERAKEKQRKMERILAKPEGARSKEEVEWLEAFMKTKKKKKLTDRQHRQRIKEAEKHQGNKEETSSTRSDESQQLKECPQESEEDEQEELEEYPRMPFALPSQYPSHAQDSTGEQLSELSTEEKFEGGEYVQDFKAPPRPSQRSVPTMSAEELLEKDNARKNLKNSRARERTAMIRDRAAMIQRKPEYDRTEEEVIFLNNFVSKKANKNLRGRERAEEKLLEMERILAKPEGMRNKEEVEWLEAFMKTKKRKKRTNRHRQQRIKEAKKHKFNKEETSSSDESQELEEYHQESQEDEPEELEEYPGEPEENWE